MKPIIRVARQLRSSPSAQSGLTLMEVVVALVILTIVGISLFSLGSMTTTGSTRNADRIAATALASSKLEDLLTSGYDALTIGGPYPDSNNPLTAGGASGGIFSRSWTIAATTITGVTASPKTVSVSVTWTNGATITMSTMIVKPSDAFTAGGLGGGFPTVSLTAMEQTQ